VRPVTVVEQGFQILDGHLILDSRIVSSLAIATSVRRCLDRLSASPMIQAHTLGAPADHPPPSATIPRCRIVPRQPVPANSGPDVSSTPGEVYQAKFVMIVPSLGACLGINNDRSFARLFLASP